MKAINERRYYYENAKHKKPGDLKDVRPIRTLFDDFIKNAFYEPLDEERMMAIDVIEKE